MLKKKSFSPLISPYVIQAPTRIDISGGTLDLDPMCYWMSDGTEVVTINAAINRYARAFISSQPSKKMKCSLTIEKSRTLTFTVGRDLLFSQYPWKKVPILFQMPVCFLSAYLSQKEHPPSHISITLSTEAPRQSGLGGSSSLLVALMEALNVCYHEFGMEEEGRFNLMKWVKDFETFWLKTPTGFQDYLASIFGGLTCYSFRFGSIKKHPLPPFLVSALNERFTLLYSNEMHESGKSNWDIFLKAQKKEKHIVLSLMELKKISQNIFTLFDDSHLVEKIKTKNFWKTLGNYINQDWQVRKNYFHWETKNIKKIIHTITSLYQPLGIRVLGAAGGGSLFILFGTKEEKIHFHKTWKGPGTILEAEMISHGVQVNTVDKKIKL